MECIECKATNAQENRFCGKCGAELGHTLDETVRKKGFRDRQATEMEITAAVVERLLKWTTWLGSALALILLAFGFFVGKSWLDIRAAVTSGQGQIATAVKDGTDQIESARSDISALQQKTAELKSEYDQLQPQASKYKLVTQRVDQLQHELNDATAKWKDIDLTVRSVRTTEVPGKPSFLGLGNPICPTSLDPGNSIALCAKGSPETFFQLTREGLRPIAGLSPDGFRDSSTGPKPNCSTANRGTIYVEKGAEKAADKPLLCAKTSDGAYEWTLLATVR